MFLTFFKITSIAVIEIFILMVLGFVLVKRHILKEEGLTALSRLVIEVIFPVLIFAQLIRNFSFRIFSNWWLFPIISLLITLAGIAVGSLFLKFIKGQTGKIQFLSLVTFQNSGYLPLALVVAIFPKEITSTVLIYIFLFLLGFDLIMWSFGVYMLTFVKNTKFEMGSLFSPPVIANLAGLFLVAIGLSRFIPDIILRPLEMVGGCTLPLAMFVVGGNIAAIHLEHIDKKAMMLVVLAKLIILPLVGLAVILWLKVPRLLGLLIMMQVAMPPATSLSVVIRHYKKEDILVSQGIFFGHVISLITIPVFLSLYFTLTSLK